METICITRHGFNFLHTQHVDCAAIVYYLPNKGDNEGTCNAARMFVPVLGWWGDRLPT